MSMEHILHHYRKEEHAFVERVIEWAERTVKTQTPVRTDFVDPRQFEIIQNIVNTYLDLTMFFDGGYQAAERKRVLIAPDYWFYRPEEMGLTFFHVKGENKFDALNHKDYMGALLNIGIKREKFGDILISSSAKQYIVAEEVADYVRMELTQIGHTNVRLEAIERNALVIPEENYQIFTLTVSSLRLDSVISHLYRPSRSKIVEMIKRSHVKINWQTIEQADYKLKAGDMISVKGYGRFKLLEEEGNTKKGRIRMKIGKLI